MYAIQNIKTGKFVYGTNFIPWPPRQFTSNNKMLTFATPGEAKDAFQWRHCGKDYRIVVLKTIEVKRVTELHKEPIDYSHDF